MHFTKQNLHSLKFSAEAFRCHTHHYLDNGNDNYLVNSAHGTKKLLLKTQVSGDFV